jgi:hypothetical protein
MANTRRLKKSQLAAELGVSPSRVSHYVAGGMPFDKDGRIDPAVARRWLAEHLDPSKVSRVSPRPVPGVAVAPAGASALSHAHGYLAAAQRAICETPVLVAIFGAEAGMTRAAVDRLADLAMLAMWHELGEAAAVAGFLRDADDLVLPADAADWRARVNWPALFDAAGAARPAGRT